MTTRDRLKEFISTKPEFSALDDATREKFLDRATSRQSNLLEYLNSDAEYSSLGYDTKRKFLARLAPEYFDTGAPLKETPSEQRTLGEFVEEVSDSILDYSPFRMMERAAGSLGAETPERKSMLGTVASGVAGQLGVQAAGLAQFAYDYNPAHISRKLAEYMGAEPNPESAALDASVQGSIAWLRDRAVEEQKQYELGTKDMGFISRSGLDIGIDLLAAIPTIAAMFVGGPATAGIMGAAQTGAVEYGDVRSKGYNPLEAGVKALPNMALAGLSAGVSAGIALDPSKPLMRRVMKNAIIDSGTGFTIPVVDAAADYLTDLIYKSKGQQPLLAPGTDAWQVVKNGLYGAFVNVGSGVFMTAAPDMVRAVKMRVNGLKETTTKDGQVIIHPVEMTDHVDQMVSNMDFTGLDAQKVYNRSAQALEAGARTAKRLDEITELQASRPLDELDLDPQAGPSKKMGRLKVDMEVDVSPKYFTEMDNKPRNMGKPAKVVKTTYPVEQTVQTIPPGGVAPITQTKRNLFVDVEFPDEPGVVHTIPRKHIVEKTRTPNSVPHESARLVRFMSDLFFPRNIPVSEWSADNARMALGGFLSVNETLSRGNLGQVKGTKGQIVWDAMRNNPEDAARILSHEPGHILANADPEVLKAMNMPEFDGFKQWITETTQTNDPAVLQRYQQAKQQNPDLVLGDFILTEKYGNELQQLWDGWELFKGSKETPEERVANALSVYMNDILGPEALPGFRSMKIRADLSDWIDSQPNLKLAFEGLRAYDFDGNGVDRYVSDMFRKSDEGLREAAKAREGREKTLGQELMDNLHDKFYSFLDGIRHDPVAVDRLDKSYMIPGRAAHFVDISFGETLRQLQKYGINFEDYSKYLFYHRIKSLDRTKTVERLIKDSPYKDFDEYREVFEFEAQTIRGEILDNYPGLTDAEVETMVQAYMKTWAQSETVKEEVVMMNPGGVDKATATEGEAFLAAKYGPDGMALMEARRKAEHQAFVDQVIPVLRESKLFSERLLLHMESNQDYATFVIARHAFKARKNNGQNRGSLDFIYEQQGTLSFTASPHPQMTELRMRMMLAAEQAGMTRDLVKIASDFEAQHYPDDPRIYKLVGDAEPKNGFELFVSKEYNPETGRVEPVRYAAKNGVLDPFHNVAEKSTFWSGFSQIHGMMKGWMTIYNPRFWLTNWLRDTARSAINAPGFSALYEIPYESAKALGEDLLLKYRKQDNPERQQMLKDYQLAGDIKSYNRADSTLTTQERVMMMADMNPAFYNKTWKEIDGFFNKLSYLYAKTTDPVKNFSAWVGSSVEFSSKAAMKRYLDKRYPKMSKEEKNWYIRNAAGTPVLNRAGNWNKQLSNLLMFYNPNMQGYVGDYQAFKRDPIGGMLKRAATVIPYMMLIGTARSGMFPVFSEDMKRWAENIPGSYFGRGFSLPTGFSADNDSGIMLLPTDPITRFMLGASYQTMNKLMTGTFKPTDIGGSILEEAAEGLPSLTPFIQTPISAGMYLAGKNPSDFMGREAIDPLIFASGETGLKRLSMLTHFAQQGWGGPLNSLGFTSLARMQLSARGSKKEKPYENRTAWEQGNTIIKTLANFPITNVLGGLFKFTSAGVKELRDLRAAPAIENYNSGKLAIKRIVNNLINKEPLTPAEIELLQNPLYERYVTNLLEDEVAMKSLASEEQTEDALALFRMLQYNPNVFEEIETLRMLGERLKKK